MSSNKKAKKSRRKFLIGLAGLGAFAYILYRYYPDILTVIQKLGEPGEEGGGSEPSDEGSKPGGTDGPGGEAPSFEGVVAPAPPINLARPYLVITDVFPIRILYPGGGAERANAYVWVQNQGYSPSLSTVLEIYVIPGDSIPSDRDDDWLRGGWLENATLIERIRFQVFQRSTVKHYITFPNEARNVRDAIIYLVYDEAYDPRDTDLISGNRKFDFESIGWL